MVSNEFKIHRIWQLKVLLKWVLLFHLGIIPFILSFQTEAFAQDKVRDRQWILNNIQATGMIRVLVQITSPRLGGLSTASQAHKVVIPGEIKTPAKIQAEFEADQALAGEIAATVNGLVSKLSGKVYTVIHQYDTLPLVALEVSMESLDILELTPEVVAIFPDKVIPLPQPIAPDSSGKKGSTNQPELVQPQLSNSVSIIGATTAWSQGYTGSGWYVAILDTGIRRTHQFFYNKTIVEACFASGENQTAPAGDCPNGSNTMYGTGAAAHHPSNYATYDHGTHVSGIAAGKKSDGSLNGVAKDANIIAVNIFSKFSSSQDVRAKTSDIIKGLDYIYTLRNTYSISAVNMSLGGGLYSSQSQCDSADALTKTAIDNLKSVGIATVIATGNSGECNGVSWPGCISSAVAVGASTKSDIQSSLSNWHSSIQDFFAPGQSIFSSTGGSDSSYVSWSGTSMATPHVTGAWAILRQNQPTASVTQLLSALNTSGVPITTLCGTGLSKPRIQVDKALGSSPPNNDIFDLNGDGKTDILWQNKDNAKVYVWYMDGVALTGGASIQNYSNSEWGGIVGTGDFNGDGKTDLLSQHMDKGDIFIWYMDRITNTNRLRLGAVTPNTGWRIVNTGDFNSDGKTDLLWQNNQTGGVYVWYMNGVNQTGGAWILSSINTGWEIVGTGDFNSDGKTDLLWQYKPTGGVYVWYMDGVNHTGGGWIASSVDTEWEIVAPK